MRSNVKKLKNCRHAIEVNLPPEKVKQAFDEVYQDIGRYANVPGFRIGKAPRDLLELHYSKTAKEEVLKKLIPETYEKILGEHKLDPIGYPDISDVKLDINEGLYYKASIEIRPEIHLKNYKGLKLKRKNKELGQEDVDKELEYLRELHSHNVPKNDSETKEKVLPKLDDDFAKGLGFENLEKLKAAVTENLKLKLEEDARVDMEMQIIDRLLDNMDFEVPESLVNSEKERLVKEAEMRIKYIEALQKKEKARDPSAPASPQDHQENSLNFLDDKDKRELEENAYKQAVRQVKAFFILDKIADTEKIYLKHEELDKYIEEMAARYKKTREEIKDYLEKGHGLNELAVNLRNKKVVEFLIKEAKIE